MIASNPSPTRRRRVIAGSGILAGLVGAVFLYAVNPAESHLFPTCMFREVTGWLCPGCGSLRASHAWLHGHVGQAVALNPLTAAGLPLLALLGANEARVASGRPGWRIDFRLGRWAWIVPAGIVVFTVLRNLR